MGSHDQTLRLRDLKDGVVMEGHGSGVRLGTVSRDGRLIASGDADCLARRHRRTAHPCHEGLFRQALLAVLFLQ